MGADGGVVYVRVREPCGENCAQARALLEPFWQLFDVRGSDWGDDSREEWLAANPDVSAPHYLVGSYGTDIGDMFCLDDLLYACEALQWEDCTELYQLTFDELDLDYRTTPLPVSDEYGVHPLHNLWHQHFKYTPRDEVLTKLGCLSGVSVSEWVSRLGEVLDLDNTHSVETWT